MSGATIVVALRDLAAGEEITFDYATERRQRLRRVRVHLRHGAVPRQVTGHDWMLPELQLRYRGYFSPYLASRIAALASAGAERRAFAY